MATVFFKMNSIQDNEVKNMMKLEGYTNKSEFFRFLVKFYKYRAVTPFDQDIEKASLELAESVRSYRKRVNPKKSIEEQLSDV